MYCYSQYSYITLRVLEGFYNVEIYKKAPVIADSPGRNPHRRSPRASPAPFPKPPYIMYAYLLYRTPLAGANRAAGQDPMLSTVVS